MSNNYSFSLAFLSIGVLRTRHRRGSILVVKTCLPVTFSEIDATQKPWLVLIRLSSIAIPPVFVPVPPCAQCMPCLPQIEHGRCGAVRCGATCIFSIKTIATAVGARSAYQNDLDICTRVDQPHPARIRARYSNFAGCSTGGSWVLGA